MISSNNSYETGMLGENYLLETLFDNGIAAQYTAKIGHSGDIMIGSTNIEIKTAKIGQYGAYKFCLVKNDSYGYTNYACSDYVILQCVLGSKIVLFLIPCQDITVKHITIRNLDNTKYNKYRVTMKQLVEKFM